MEAGVLSTDRLLTADLSLYGSGITDPQQQIRTFEEIARRWSTVPEVEAVG